MKVLIVTGSRKWTDGKVIHDALLGENATHLVHGGAKGADKIAANWGAVSGLWVRMYEADWNHRKAAGPIRNQLMVDSFPDATVLAFPLEGSRGTWDCVNKAKKAGLTVKVFDIHGEAKGTNESNN